MAVACLKWENALTARVAPDRIERFARSPPASLCCNAGYEHQRLTHRFEFGMTREQTMTQTAQLLRETEIKELIQRRFRQMAPLLRGHKVYLFGSRARGRARPRSDFDIGVLGDEPLPLRDFYAIEEALDELPTYTGLTGLT